MNNNKFYCIKNYTELGNELLFEKGNYYKYESYGVNIFIYDNENNMLKYNIYSYFGKYVSQKHFITLNEYRKTKLLKLNDLNILRSEY